jgi:hypothetical protein
MAADAVDTGLGATVTFSGLSAPVVSIDMGDQTIEMLDSSHLGTTSFVEKVVGDLIDAGTITIETLFDTPDTPLTTGTLQTLTVTWPQRGGESAAATLVGTAAVTSQSFPSLVRNEVQKATITFEFDGQTGPAYTPSTQS